MRNGGVGGQKRASHGVTFISSESRVRQLTTKLADTSRKKAEQGQHQALLDRHGAYWRLYEAQARRAEAEQGLVSASDIREVRT